MAARWAAHLSLSCTHFPLSYPESSLPLTDTLLTLILGRSRTANSLFLLGLELVKVWVDGKGVVMENSQQDDLFYFVKVGMATQTRYFGKEDPWEKMAHPLQPSGKGKRNLGTRKSTEVDGVDCEDDSVNKMQA